MRVLLFFLALSSAVGASAQTIHDEVLSQQDDPSIHYAISVPRDYHREPVPLILALHFGGDPRGAGHAMLQILIQPALGVLGAVIVAPDSLDGRWSTPANELAAGLRVGQDVITTSGLFGTVAALDESSVTLLVAPGIELRYDRRAVGRVLDDEQDGSASDTPGG